jgi:hypothetical protein
METVLGLFSRFEEATHAIRDLEAAGFSAESLTILSRQAAPGENHELKTRGNKTRSIKELVAETENNILGALATLVISNEEAQIYAGSVKQGGALVIVRTPNGRAAAARLIMAHSQAIEIQQIFPRQRNTHQRQPGESEDNGFYYPLLWDQIKQAK